jgi:quercetin dioxygenase-like cupin family protein
MKLQSIVAIGVAVLVVVGWWPSPGPYGGTPSVQAQGQAGAPEQPKGVKAKNLVTSLGGFRGTANVPVVLTGQVVEIEPGGQTGRQRHMVPSYIYVLEGVLTTNSFGGPVGVDGVQYHAAGQSYMDAVGVWHNHMNGSQAPVKYLLLLISTPGGQLTQKAGTDD